MVTEKGSKFSAGSKRNEKSFIPFLVARIYASHGTQTIIFNYFYTLAGLNQKANKKLVLIFFCDLLGKLFSKIASKRDTRKRIIYELE